MRFEISAKSGAARRGRLTFARGVVDTPAFMPVGTYGTVKAVTPEELEELGSQIILGNTFHLLLRPGVEVVRKILVVGDIGRRRAVQPSEPLVLVVIGPDRSILLPQTADPGRCATERRWSAD